MSRYSDEVLADSPVLYLNLDETSGTACDNLGSLGSAADGTSTGTVTRNIASGNPSLVVGADIGGATTDAITVPDQAGLDLTGDFTYECLVKPDGVASFQVLMCKGQDSTPTNAGYSFRISNGAKLQIIKTNLALLAESTGLLTAGRWAHVAVTRSGNVYTFYINGVAAGGGTDSTTINATNKAFQIGRNISDVSTFAEPYNGVIDEVAVYNTALSADRIAAHVDAINRVSDRALLATMDGVWVKPAGTSFARVICAGAGGGGGAGAGNNTFGGTGGGGGAVMVTEFLAADLDATESIVVGIGGTGGASSGADGTAGGKSSFAGVVEAGGGGLGRGGNAATRSGGGGGGIETSASGTAGDSGTPRAPTTSDIAGRAAPDAPPAGGEGTWTEFAGASAGGAVSAAQGGSSTYGGPGGGGGGTMNGGVGAAGFAGGTNFQFTSGGGGTAGGVATAGGHGDTSRRPYTGQGGGGGGGANTGGTGGRGGNGGPCAGGGGGGSATTPGAGGNGGDGYVAVVSW